MITLLTTQTKSTHSLSEAMFVYGWGIILHVTVDDFNQNKSTQKGVICSQKGEDSVFLIRWTPM